MSLFVKNVFYPKFLSTRPLSATKDNFKNFFISVHHNLTSHWDCSKKILFNSPSKEFCSKNCSSEEHPPKPSGIPGIIFQRASPKDLTIVQGLLRYSFFKDEPILKALGWTDKIDPEFIAYQGKLLLEGLTILAIDATKNQIIAAAINRIAVSGEHIAKEQEIDQIQCPLTQRLARFWNEMSCKPDIFAMFDVPEYMEITYLVTTPAARGKRLAEKLSRESLLLAKETGAPLAVMYCTNIASARIAQKLSMKLIGSECICNYFSGPDLLGLINLPYPNDRVYVFAITVNMDSKDGECS